MGSRLALYRRKEDDAMQFTGSDTGGFFDEILFRPRCGSRCIPFI